MADDRSDVREIAATTGIRLTSPEGGFDQETRQDLAIDTVVAALSAFRDEVLNLKENRWNPAKGASLKTFFIGQCKWQFPNVCQKWRRLHQQPALAPSCLALLRVTRRLPGRAPAKPISRS